MSIKESPQKQLLWSQRLALVRHHLHIAHRTRDFTFFRALQLQTLVRDTDHTSLLASALSASANSESLIQEPASLNRGTETIRDADVVISSLDKLAAVMASLYEDAFQSLCNHVRTAISAPYQRGFVPESQAITDSYHDAVSATARRQATCQRARAEAGIDKMLDSAVVLITQLPPSAQDAASSILIQSIAFAADAISVCLIQMDRIEHFPHGHSQLEAAAETVASVVAQAVSAMKGIFGLMSSVGDSNQQPAIQREMVVAATEHDEGRKSSTFGDPGAMARGWARRLSSALTQSSSSETSVAGSRKGSIIPSAAGLQQWLDQHHRQDSPSFSKTPGSESKTRADHVTDDETRSVHLSSGVARELDPLPSTPSESVDPFLDTSAYDDVDLAQRSFSSNSPNKAAFRSNLLHSNMSTNGPNVVTPQFSSTVAIEDATDPLDTSPVPTGNASPRRRNRNLIPGNASPFLLPEHAQSNPAEAAHATPV